MRNRINQLPSDAAVSFYDRVQILRERKIEDTRDKKDIGNYRDGDDYGSVKAPDDFVFHPHVNHENGGWYGYEGWSETFYRLMDEHPIHIDPCDAFCNRWMFALIWLRQPGTGWNPDYPYDHLKADQQTYGLVPGIGSDAHFGGDYQIGLDLGWGGLLEKLAHYRGVNPQHDEFYRAEVRVINGIQQWMRHTSQVIADAISQETNPVLRDNLEQMLACNDYLVDGRPRTLREACQWICYFNMASRTYNRDGAGGQLDELLRPYYERDLAQGLIDKDEARYYIACLLLNDPHYYQLGGIDAQGNDLVSPFSYLILEAADWLDSSCNLTVRVHEQMDKDFLFKSVEYLFKNKNGWPRFSGDAALSEGFMKKGYPLSLARQRIAVGCNWMSLPGLEYTLNDCLKMNHAKIFQIALDELLDDGGERSTERLWQIYLKHQARAVDVMGQGIMFHLKHQVHNEPELLLNLISHGPVERGRDMVDQGAQYYNMGIDGTGIATVADSFAALQQRIEDEQRLSWDQLAAALRSNYDGPDGEYIRLMLAASQRYGGGQTIGDQWAERVSSAFADEVNALDERHAPVKFIPGWFSWSNTIKLGKEVRATPNGRRDGQPISHGANPHPGFRRDGAVTAMSNSICQIQPGYGNTAPIQLELDPGLACDREAVQKICDYILTICEQGATLLNINIIDADQILAADKNPELFPDLVVRVTGFTAYFCLLTPEFRQLVVDRILAAQ